MGGVFMDGQYYEAIITGLPDDVEQIIENWDLIQQNRTLFEQDIFYYNVPVLDCYIEDDLNNKIDLTIGDLLSIQELIPQLLSICAPQPHDLFFYKLRYVGLNHIGVFFAFDRETTQTYAFVFDGIAYKFGKVYNNLGFKYFDKKNATFPEDYHIPSCCTITDLIESLEKGILLSDYIRKKLENNQLFLYSDGPFLFPTDIEDKYIISTIQNQIGG